MTRSLKSWATAALSVMVLTVTLGLSATVDSAEARPAYMKYDGVDGEASKPARPGSTLKRARGKICCSVPRIRKPALVTPRDCRAVKGKVIPQKKCARSRPVSAAKFSNIVLKRGVISRSGASQKPGGPTSLKASKGQMSVYCANGNQYFPCWCEGAGSCNNFIAACVGSGGELGCTEHNAQGQPTSCSCMK